MTSMRNVETEKLDLHYCGSGFSISYRLNVAPQNLVEGICQNLISTSIYLKKKFDSHNKIKLCGLFNAHTEQKIPHKVESVGINFKNLFSSDHPMVADSGGLQAMQQMGSIDDDAKQRIYKTQSQFSDLCLSFDEMPWKMRRGERIYLGNFVAGEMGKKAGRNLREQIKYFNKNKSKAKIIPIVQGRGQGVENYTLNMLGELSQKQLKTLDHISLGGIIWENEFVIAERAISVYNMDGIPTQMLQNMHLLGCTGFRRLLPVVIGARNGLLSGIKKLSFDSTTLLRSFSRGFVYPSIDDMRAGKPYTLLGKVRNRLTEEYFEELWNFWKNIQNNPFKNVEDMLESSYLNSKGYHTETQQYNELGFEAGLKSTVLTIWYVKYNEFKFLQILEMYLNGEIQLEDFMYNYKDLHHLQTLETINCADDFQYWYDDSVRYMVESSKKTDPNSGIDATSFLF